MRAKNISNLLITTLLLSNLNSFSFANSTSEDGRYEVFEGNNISIDNILEEDKADVEIEGKTLVNQIKFNNKVINHGEAIDYQEMHIKENQMYTVVIDVLENSLDDGIWFSAWEFSGQIRHLPCSIENPSCFMDESKVKADFRMAENGQTGRYILRIGIAKKNPGKKNRFALFTGSSTIGRCVANAMVFEGNLDTDEIPNEYFEGVKSVGENSDNSASLDLKVSNKNLFDISKWTNVRLAGNKAFDGIDYENKTVTLIADRDDTYIQTGATGSTHIMEHERPYLIKVKPNTKYSISFKKDNTYAGSNYIQQYDKYYNSLGVMGIGNSANDMDYKQTFVTNPDTEYIGIRFGVMGIGNTVTYSDIQLELSEEATLYTDFISYSKEIKLNEPLRALPNGVKDRIIKKDGKWYIERNCDEIIFDGSDDEDWTAFVTSKYTNVNNALIRIEHNFITKGACNGVNAVSNYNIGIGQFSQNDIIHFYTEPNILGFFLDKSVASSMDEFKNVLKQNPLVFVYKLAVPVYELISDEMSISLYEESTYITASSNIPAKLKVTVDRVANKAVEAIDLAKLTPTVENIEIARMWTNLLRDSSMKDNFQDSINNITNVNDIKLEKKKVSANLDMYIKPENSMSMSLSTNSITFDNYTGLEDIEKLGALDITINSSLPYSLNAYMPKELSNSDSSSSMGVNLLNIRDNTESSYSQFANTIDKVVLKDDCDKGNNKVHTIDLKLASDRSFKPDIYKAVIKFEAEQK